MSGDDSLVPNAPGLYTAVMKTRALAALFALMVTLCAQPPRAGEHQEQPKPTTNRMAKEQSPYLQQHKHDPVDWHPWGKGAFEKARDAGKPVFLSVGYAACHWCHVMQRESFQNKDIAAYMNEHFISIKLDREERPDIDRIYMEACQIMKQGGGGWPLSAFLTSDKQPFYVDTYIPPDRFKKLLEAIHKAWNEADSKKLLMTQTANFAKYLKDIQQRGATEDLPDPEMIEEANLSLLEGEDQEHGGFARPPRWAPKFPSPSTPLFLLREAARQGDPRTHGGAAVKRMLDAVLRGGIRDHLAGGFHRYSTDRLWKLPHFEKMLYDQALLAQLFLEAAQVWDEERYRQAVRETLDWCLSDMRTPEGGFISAYDADADHVEGATYVWRLQELHKLLSKEEAAAMIAWSGATEAGNWREQSTPAHETKTNILYESVSHADAATKLGIDESQLRTRLASARKKLLKARASHPQPMADIKVLAGWNGLMISALARAGVALREPRYVAEALKTAKAVDAGLRQKDGRYLRSLAGGVARHPGTLFDHAALLVACLDLHEATLDGTWLSRARGLVTIMDTTFKTADGGYVDSTASDLIHQTRALFDGARPSGSSMAVLGLVRLSILTADEALSARAHEVFKAINGALTRAPQGSPHALIALDLVHRPALKVELHGEGGEGLLVHVRNEYNPFASVTRKSGTKGDPFVLVCVGKTCLEPAKTADEVRARIQQALAIK